MYIHAIIITNPNKTIKSINRLGTTKSILSLTHFKISTSMRKIFIRNIFTPKPMVFPNNAHFFNGNSLSFREEEVDENRHNEDEKGEEEEESELKMAKHSQEDLSNNKSEEHVYGYVDTLGC